jgi:hypothetical protein
MVRFWLVLLYQCTSKFGRSLVRPLLFWLAVASLSAVCFLNQSLVIKREFQDANAVGTSENNLIGAISRIAPWWEQEPCFAAPLNAELKGLPEPLRRSTSASAEAWHLAFRNGLVLLAMGSEEAHRTLGCLYGTNQSAIIVPRNVSVVLAMQKVVSAALIFLFGLALRNTLRVK